MLSQWVSLIVQDNARAWEADPLAHSMSTFAPLRCADLFVGTSANLIVLTITDRPRGDARVRSSIRIREFSEALVELYCIVKKCPESSNG